MPKVIIPPCPFSCFRCVLRCVPFPCVLKSLFLLRSTVRSSVLRIFQWIPAWIPTEWIPIKKGISKQLHPDFFWSILCHLLDCHLALVKCDFRFMVEKMVESEVLVFTQSNTTNAFKLLFDSLLLHRTKKTVLFVHFAA